MQLPAPGQPAAALPEGPELEQLKVLAKAGDRQALQRLRESGYFERKLAERKGFAASHAQRRLWTLDRVLEGRSPAYNVPLALQLEGRLERDALLRALRDLIARHESLRTALRELDGELRQFVAPQVAFEVPLLDLSAQPDPQAAARAAALHEAAAAFDLGTAPLLRALLLRLGPAQHVLLLMTHHVVFDEWSAGVLLRELGEAYCAHCNGAPPPWLPLPMQYKDFAQWQNTRLAAAATERHREYWRGKLAAAEPLELPTDRPRAALQTFNGSVVTRQFAAPAIAGLAAFARREAASMFMAIAAVVKALLQRYTAQTDLTVGTTITGRDRHELAGQIGFYVNTLALRDVVEPQTTFRALLQRLRTTATEAYEHQEYPFDRLVDELGVTRDLSRMPLFDVMLAVNEAEPAALVLQDLQVCAFELGYTPAKYDLTLDWVHAAGVWTLRIIYNSDLYDAARIERLALHLESLMLAVVAAPDVPLGALDFMSAAEQQQVLAFARGPLRHYPAAASLPELFAAQVARTPAACALRVADTVAGAVAFTYRELAQRAAAVTAALAGRVAADAPVAVLTSRGDALVTALLGVLGRGAVYLPFDPALPRERLAFMAADAGAQAIVVDAECAERAAELGISHVIRLDALADAPAAAPTAVPRTARDRAYLIYTSGSSGRPKGVAVEHGGFINMITAQIAAFGVQPGEPVLQFASCAFDASLSEIFMTLLAGACLVCPLPGVRQDPGSLQQLLLTERIGVATLPPPYIRALGFEALRSLRLLITAGEDAVPDAGQLAAAGCTYINAYGPTEFSVCATLGPVPAQLRPPARVPIGRPLANCEVLVLERGAVRCAPIGIPGEICLSGAGLARGYVGRPALTAAAFVAHPWREGQRMYRTGDLGRWRQDGSLEFLGRLDEQVKLSGYRIEPGEIAAVLRRQPGVDDAVLLVRDERLIAYVAAQVPVAAAQLRRALASELPEYMVPAAIIVLPALPRLPSGKVDRARLPAPHIDAGARVPPRNAAEARLAAIWREVLGVERLGIHDRFLELGGNSMKAIVIASRVLRDLGTRLSIRDVFEQESIARLAAMLGAPQDAEDIPRLAAAEHHALSHAQRRLWTLERMGEAQGAYHVCGALRLEGSVDPQRLGAALQRVAQRHESLRTTFIEVEAVPRQRVHERLPLDLAAIEVLGPDPDAQVRGAIEADMTRPFDLEAGPLFRVRLFVTGAASAVLYVNFHHVISDAWSIDVFFRELVAAWCGAAPADALAIHYKDFAAWQNTRLGERASSVHREYWQRVLQDVPVLELPLDRPRPAVKAFAGGTVRSELDPQSSRAFERLALEQQLTPVALWVSLLSILVNRYGAAQDLVVGLPATFREHPALEQQIGFFINMVPLRIRLAPDDAFDALASRVRRALHEALAHKDYPYDLMVEELAVRRDMSRNPLFDIAVSVQEDEARAPDVPGLRASAFAFEGRTSKFDLTLFASRRGGVWELVLEYDVALFDRWRVERILHHLGVLLRAAAAAPQARIADLELLDAAERALVCERWNQSATDYPREASLVQLFRECVARGPQRAAVAASERTLTYAELDCESDRIAGALQAAGPLGPIVPILLPRSAHVPAAILGVLKSGAAYAPLDLACPPARIRRLLQMLGARVLLTDAAHAALLDADAGVHCVDVAAAAAPGRSVPSHGADCAYVMFTSGSTGEPKGVLVEQRAVTRLVRNTSYVEVTAGDRFLQLSSLAFDAATFEIWGALLNGATLCVPSAAEAAGGMEVRGWLATWRPTILWLTASLFNQLAEFDGSMFREVRVLLTGGERLSPSHVAQVQAACAATTIVNGYGPTENTTFSLCHRITAPAAGDIPLGGPISNSRAYIVDERLQPVPVGVPGEILVAGDGLARGYLGDAALTEQRFVTAAIAGGRAYRTGDRGAWRPDGTIAFLGRSDDQVKVRGFRVEPGELAAALRAAGASDAAVVARANASGTQELVAYVTGDPALERTLRARLELALPPYLLPAHIVRLERLPLTPNGKLDRRRLPDPTPPQASAVAAGMRAVSAREQALVLAWSQVLGREPSLEDNYFDLGGDSIQAIQIASRLRRAGWVLRVRDLLRHPTIAALAPRLSAPDTPAAAQPEPHGPAPLSPIQAWFLQQPGPHAQFNQSVLLRAARRLDERALRSALAALIERHAALRTAFNDRDGRCQAVLTASRELPLQTIDLVAEADASAALSEHIRRLQGSLDPANGRLVAAALLRLADGERLFVGIHHLAVDAVSWRILLEELERAYHQALQAKVVDLGPPSASYGTWARALQARTASGAFDNECAYWRRIEAARSVPLPYDLADVPPGTFGEAQTTTIELDASTTAALLAGTFRAYGARVDELLLTALARTLCSFIAHPRCIVMLEGHGRGTDWLGLDVGRTVGWFTALFPVVLDLAGTGLGDDVKAVKETLRRVPRGGVGYGALRYLAEAPLQGAAAPVSFNYLGRFGGGPADATFVAEAGASGSDIAAGVPRAHHLDISGAIAGERLQLAVTYSPARFERASMQRLAAAWCAEVRRIVDHCVQLDAAEKTPCDFTACDWTLAEYAAFLRDHGLRAADIDDVAWLSPLQEGLLYQHRLDPESTAYHVQLEFAVQGALDLERYRAAWSELARRHPMLRTAFFDEGLLRPVQVVLQHAPFELTWRKVAQEDEVAAYRQQDLRRPFAMRHAPLWRLAVFETGRERFRIVWSVHHILIDGWSMAIVHRELAQLYAALAAGTAPPQRPPRPFTAFIRWLASVDLERAKAYWASYLAGCAGVASLPRQASPAAGYRFHERTYDAGAGLSTAVQSVAARLGVTLHTVVQAAWACVLARHCARADVTFGSIVSGRPPELEHVEETVGLFINALPLRVRPAPHVRFADLTTRLQRDVAEQAEHHALPLAEIQRIAAGGGALFDHLLVCENYPTQWQAGEQPGTGLRIEAFAAFDQSHYDLNLIVVPGAQLRIRASCNANAYSPAMLDRYLAHLFTVLEAASTDPQLRVDELPLPASEHALLRSLQGRPRQLPAPQSVLEMIAGCARRAPQAAAVQCGANLVSYAELAEQSDRLAAWLLERGIRAEDRIAVLLERSERLVIALLAVLKAGAAYVPIDPAYPQARIEMMLHDCDAAAVLVATRHAHSAGARAIDVERAWPEVLRTPLRPLQPPHAAALAYVIYTSGSSGRPKGCQIEHRNLAHYVEWAARSYFAPSQRGTFALHSSIAFDLTLTSLFVPLARGDRLQVLPQSLEVHEALARMFEPDSGIDAVKLTPAHISLLPELGLRTTSVAVAVVGGEALRQDHVRILRALNPAMAIFNEYGPTETTVGCVVKRIGAVEEPITIGTPLEATHLQVIDAAGRPVPIGVPGELLIGGAGVGRGYLGLPQLTAERFGPGPEGGRCYHSGDRVRWLPTGELDYLGRVDDQVKIRGHRIEPAEIEAAILRCAPGIAGVAVVARHEGAADTLVAYVTGALDSASLRAALAEVLPEALIPSAFVPLERIPLTANGKLDRAALPAPTTAPAAADAGWCNETEACVATIWQQVLGHEQIRRQDKFFALGGHSLNATQIVSRILRQLGVKIALREFFAAATVPAVAALIESRRGAPMEDAIPAVPMQPQHVLSAAQQRLWLLHQLAGGAIAYNLPFALEIEGGELDLHALAAALTELAARHEALRTSFGAVAGEPHQQIHAQAAPIPLQVVDCRAEAPVQAEARARAALGQAIHAPFDLMQAPLARVLLVRMPAGKSGARSLLLLTLHHIAADGWSLVILIRELAALYAARVAATAVQLPALRLQYKDFAHWQARRDWRPALAWWREALAGARCGVELPYDLQPTDERSFRGAAVRAQVSAVLAERLRELGAQRAATLAHVMLGIFQLVLYKLSGQQDQCLGMSVSGRTRPELEHLVGFFVNLVPVRVQLSADLELAELITRVSRAAADAQDHECPFDLLVRELRPQRIGTRQPLVNVVYAFQRFDDLRLEALPAAGEPQGTLTMKPYPFEFGTSKFDLTLFVADAGPQQPLGLVLEYDTALFRAPTAERILAALCRFAGAAVEPSRAAQA